jgi:hypothetical protein
MPLFRSSSLFPLLEIDPSLGGMRLSLIEAAIFKAEGITPTVDSPRKHKNIMIVQSFHL